MTELLPRLVTEAPTKIVLILIDGLGGGRTADRGGGAIPPGGNAPPLGQDPRRPPPPGGGGGLPGDRTGAPSSPGAPGRGTVALPARPRPPDNRPPAEATHRHGAGGRGNCG